MTKEQILDIARLLAFSFIKVTEEGPYSGIYRGHEEWRKFIAALLQTWENPQLRDFEILGVGNRLVVLLKLKAKARSSGKEIEMPLTEVFKLRNCKVVELRPFYWDTAEILRSLK